VRKKSHLGFPNSIEVSPGPARRLGCALCAGTLGRRRPAAAALHCGSAGAPLATLAQREPQRAGRGPGPGPARPRCALTSAHHSSPPPAPQPLPTPPAPHTHAVPASPAHHQPITRSPARPPARPQIHSYSQKEFFTSFLSREDAYRLITNSWQAAV
jgi:hypothetical protein